MSWAEANKLALDAELARLKGLLGRGRRAEQPEPAAVPALDTLCGLFGLSDFERSVVLLCAGVELDDEVERLCPEPSFRAALALLPDPHWDALSPGRPLRHWRLVEAAPSPTLVGARLRIDERILHFLVGVHHVDARLRPLARELGEPAELAPSHRRAADELSARMSELRVAGRWPVVALGGPEPAAKREVAAAACESAGWSLVSMRAEAVPEDPADAAELRRLWERECALGGAALLVDAEAAVEPARRAAVGALVDGMQATVIVAAADPGGFEPSLRVDLERAPVPERRELWAEALGPRAAELNGRLDAVVGQFALDPPAMRAAGAEALGGHSGDLGDRLWDACRVRSRPRLDDLGQRIEASTGWDDLVLPAAQLAALRQIAAQARRRATVYEDWGFAARSRRGLGISVLFAGPSGTGKTMAAELLANELRLDLYRIDLSSVVSKYIGETEKNLRRVFDAADRGGAVLLFDEADALFGKRTEVSDSHDRFANIEVSYLLQRMEAYEGLAILTTNMRSALDQAFVRRLRFVVEFPFPDAAQRAEIWRRAFPAAVPTEALDSEALARMDIAGGNIRNVALGAAFLAADEERAVRMDDVLAAARTEYAKLERPAAAAAGRGAPA